MNAKTETATKIASAARLAKNIRATAITENVLQKNAPKAAVSASCAEIAHAAKMISVMESSAANAAIAKIAMEDRAIVR